ncbi:MAG: CoA pyrophosphatase [Actinomycetota bacterium]|nr:CoA pyrophosphatase [Actinomycetota bacterium]
MDPALRKRLRDALDREPAPRSSPGARIAAVLLPLIDADDPSMVFTRRTEDLPRHPGEISFPGGMQEEADGGPRDAALREVEEELGIAPGAVEVLGALPRVHTVVSGILIVPFVGMLAVRPAFRPDAGEIAEVLEYPVSRLLDAETTVEWPIGDHMYRGFAYEMDGNTIWGATAHILHDFLTTVKG